MFNKILIANRGEIACRVMRTARAMGVRTVAVYSEADTGALHVADADEAVAIGGAAAADSYLRGDRIIDAAIQTGAQAIHPGYGFLSENPDFVDQVTAAGLTFIGPPADAIRAMGLKDAAKRAMEAAGVPVVPGYHGDDQDPDRLADQADAIGYPVLIKARAGGGGKGMRKVDDPADFRAALEGAQREGQASFGDPACLIEKWITAPRHIEIQVFGDNHGNAVHLYERDCSLQRRHQKVIEEAPAPGMTPEMRAAMGDAAVKAAKAISYSGAGTVEFIVDGSDGLHPEKFWFMEMNTRLQVEHPVTEAITGLDLVEWQLRVAAGAPLPLTQDQIPLNGHAFEARIYAEDASRNFLPAPGALSHLTFPEGARVDSGVRAGDEITPHYDPMIAKLITHGADRGEALGRLSTALDNCRIAGTVTNTGFLAALARHSGFAAGEVDTGLIDRNLAALTETGAVPVEALICAALTAHAPPTGDDPWTALTGFHLWAPLRQTVVLVAGEERHVIGVAAEGGGRYAVSIGDDTHAVTIDWADDALSLTLAGVRTTAHIARAGQRITVFLGGAWSFEIPDPLTSGGDAAAGGDTIAAPMSGLVKLVSAAPGETVAAGDPMMVLEAMKMEHTLTAPRDGVIAEISAKAGEQVAEGALLLSLEPEDA